MSPPAVVGIASGLLGGPRRNQCSGSSDASRTLKVDLHCVWALRGPKHTPYTHTHMRAHTHTHKHTHTRTHTHTHTHAHAHTHTHTHARTYTHTHRPMQQRPLSVLSQLYRVWTGVKLEECMVWQEKWEHPHAYDFRKKRGATDVAALIALLIVLHTVMHAALRVLGWTT